MSKKRILLGVTLGELGGAQKVVYNLAAGLPEDEFAIDIVCGKGYELPSWIARLNESGQRINLIQLPDLGRELNLKQDMKALLQLFRLMKKRKYHITHFHSSKMGILGRTAAKMARVPKIYFTVHGWAFNDYQSRKLNTLSIILERICAKFTDKIICVAKEDKKIGLAKKIATDKFQVIHNGISPQNLQTGLLREMLGIGEETLLIGTIARCTVQKAPEFFLQIAKEFGDYFQGPYKFVFIGDGPLYEDCRRTVETLELTETIHFLGSHDNAASLLSDLDLFVLWSRWESLPVSIIEAMFAGKPVLVSAVGGNGELVEDGVTGYLVPSLDKEAILYKLLSLATQKELRETLGQAGYLRAEGNFKLQEMINKHIFLYGEPKKRGRSLD